MIDVRPLGRLHAPDINDARFPMRAVLPRRAPTRTYRYWYNRFNLNQIGGTCVLNTWAHWKGNSPRTWTIAALDSLAPQGYRSPVGERGFRGWAYDRAQAIDEFASTPPDEGTSVRAGAKVLQELGLISSYHWATTVDEIVAAILDVGSVAFGSNIYEGMYYVDDGDVWKPTGAMLGGHAYCLDGVNTKTGMIRVQTWGRHYKISIADVATLLAGSGEACIAVEP